MRDENDLETSFGHGGCRHRELADLFHYCLAQPLVRCSLLLDVPRWSHYDDGRTYAATIRQSLRAAQLSIWCKCDEGSPTLTMHSGHTIENILAVSCCLAPLLEAVEYEEQDWVSIFATKNSSFGKRTYEGDGGEVEGCSGRRVTATSYGAVKHVMYPTICCYSPKPHSLPKQMR